MADDSSGGEKPIGVFDSGIGGLTVVRQLMKLLPNENIIYFGDTARVPYGSKSAEVVRGYAVQDTKFLIAKDVKLIVVACNTASAVAMDVVMAHSSVPAIGVIQPTAAEALEVAGRARELGPSPENALPGGLTKGAGQTTSRNRPKSIGIIGTLSTINSCAYSTALKNLDKNATVMAQACPLFVPLAEEGFFDHEVTDMMAREYLSMFIGKIDVMILGCTHYPLLRGAITQALGNEVVLVDAGEATAKASSEHFFHQ